MPDRGRGYILIDADDRCTVRLAGFVSDSNSARRPGRSRMVAGQSERATSALVLAQHDAG